MTASKTRWRTRRRAEISSVVQEELDRVSGGPLASIQARFQQLPQSQRMIAAFVLSHLDDVAFLTAAQLAERCGTSEATVIRFAKGLGFGGYPDFQLYVRTLVRQKLGPGQKMRRAAPIPTELHSLVDKLFDQHLSNLQETRRILSTETLDQVANAIVQARHVYVVGLRGSAGAAQALGYSLSIVRPNVLVLLESGPMMLESLVSVVQDDLLIGISMPRYTRWTVDALHYARRQGASTIAITDTHLSPAAQAADNALVANVEALFNNSYGAVSFLLELLATAVLSLDPERTQRHLDAIEKIFENQNLFYMSEGPEGLVDRRLHSGDDPAVSSGGAVE
ncbi:MAG: MurR/RpiR family transcriptional regulator [Rhizobiaceae bacterium]